MRRRACPRRLRWSLAALLDEPADELLRVGLEHPVDLVEHAVDVGDEVLLAGTGLRRGGGGLGTLVRGVVPALGAALLLARHVRDLSLGAAAMRAAEMRGRVAGDPPHSTLVGTCRDAEANSRSRVAASGLRSRRRPTLARVPRSGSSIGTRCSEAWPGTSKITESHEAAAIWSGYFSRHLPRK